MAAYSQSLKNTSPTWSDTDSDSEFDFELRDCGPDSHFGRTLASLYGWERVPSGTLDFFVDEMDYCDDPFHCCHPELLEDVCDEVYVSRDMPLLLHLKHVTDCFIPWESGFSKPVNPPFYAGWNTYLLPRPGEIFHRCLTQVAKSWDPSLPCEFRAESDNPGNPEITTEEQGVVVPAGPQPAAPSMNTLAVAATGTPLESEWKLFFAYHTTINWNTRDASGKVLFSQRLSPKLNPYLKFISKIYSAWSGSVDIRFTVSGSGVFGGKLAAVIVPPGVDSSGGISLLQFPHVLFDARQTEPVIFNVPDIRSILWHSMSEEETSTLVIVVYNELINPYSNSDNGTDCSITVETRPGADFQFSLLKPPTRILSGGKEPSDLIPKSSLLWEGNRLAGQVVTFAINPTIGQANRHFDTNKSTYGWSSPKHGCIDVYIPTQGTHKAITRAEVRDTITPQLVPGVPDGWPDYSIPSITKSGEHTAMSDYNGLNYGYFCGTMKYTSTNQGTGSKIEPAVIMVGELGENGSSATATNRIWNQTILVSQISRTAGTYRLIPMMNIRSGHNDGPIGDDLNRVVYYDKLPTATTRNGNYPLYFVSNYMSNYGSSGIQVYNSQILHMSSQLASAPYNIGPDSFAVYRIKDSTGKWFDVGVAADGFCFVGSFTLHFSAMSAPYTASYMGIQSAQNQLAHNVTAGQSRAV
ncbi:capsid protein [Vesivirus ferret badger/JX12/China/2012]|uniref:Calicivirus coat protein domain-containing protein n=1 Tax=Ferret badger calicivirus TaxID=1564920 RepID=A0A0U1XJV8_9CALI|nr:capsid protein [Vesivirus ferret badger/JX12/China/2012]AIU99582.1 hypothetical protein [Ferret badger calicivirus]AJO15927.1 capsid protein [Vesivirus ferret badger/JX12/China/2012]